MTTNTPSQRSLRDTQFIRAIAWTGIGKYAGQALRWGTTFIVARILSPSDYGLVGMTGLFSGLVYLLSEFGVGAAVIKQRDLDESSLAKLNGLAAVTGIVAALVGWAASGPLARFFGQPEIQNIVRVSSIGFLLGSMQSVRSAILQRDMRFKTLASIEFTNAVLVAALVLVGALLGLGYWSLVLPSLVASAVSLVWLCTLVSVPIALPDLRPIREAARFSAWVFSGRVGAYLFFTSDFLVVGRVLGDAALGSYQFAWGLANTPNDQVNGLVARVSGPFYSALQHDRREIANLFKNLLESVSVISVPLVLGLAAVAPEFIEFVLGAKWKSAILPLQILCVFNTVRIIPILAAPVLQMIGEVRFQAVATFIGLSYMPVAFFVGAKQMGAEGVALAWLLAYPPLLLLIAYRTSSGLGMGLSELFASLIPALVCGSLMVCVVYATRTALPTELSGFVRLLTLVGAGAATYLLTLVLLFRSRVVRYKRSIAMLRR